MDLEWSAHGPDNLGDRGSSRMRLCLIRLALKALNITLLQDAKALLGMLAQTSSRAMSESGVRGGTAAFFQWVQIPPGDRSSRKQPEQSWR